VLIKIAVVAVMIVETLQALIRLNLICCGMKICLFFCLITKQIIGSACVVSAVVDMTVADANRIELKTCKIIVVIRAAIVHVINHALVRFIICLAC
jgi:hypothetical protein